MLLVYVFIVIFFSEADGSLLYASLVLLIAGLTDVLDGYIARKYKLVTKFGQIIDPLADKLMQLAVLFCLTIANYITKWILIIYIIKEILMILGAIILYYRKEKMVISSNFYGKIATLLFYLAVFSVFLSYPYSLSIFIIALTSSIFAFFQYVLIAKKKINFNQQTPFLENPIKK